MTLQKESGPVRGASNLSAFLQTIEKFAGGLSGLSLEKGPLAS